MAIDETFKLFVNSNSNNVENLMKWLKDAGVTSDADEGTTRKYFANSAPDSQNVTLSQFRAVLFLVAQSQKINEQIIEDRLKSKVSSTLHIPKWQSDREREAAAERYFHNLSETGKIIDVMYEKLSGDGKTNVDGIVQFLKDSTIMDVLRIKEDQVRLLLSGVKGKVDRNQFKDLMFNLGRSNVPSHRLSFNETGTNTLSREQDGIQKCYFTVLCKIANIIDGKCEKLVQDGKAGCTEIIHFLQDTTIMDALQDKKREILGPPMSKRRRSSVVIRSPSSTSIGIQGVQDKGLAPSPPAKSVSSTTHINAPATSTTGKSNKGILRESTSASRLSGQKDKKQLSGQKDKKQLSGQRLSGQRLSGQRLSAQSLSGHRLSGHRLSGHRLSGHRLSGHRLSGQRLSGQRLSGQKSSSQTGQKGGSKPKR
ncbi:uncharacterized protein LOC113225728 [Hyposmocoma kahamanoa]|uniref:uncharacterized protein LOC113225728 n=1 Tax=Hyposmocoma kahamanoa TaxID=1477025 RepID=UPI000E6DA35E|nr:uncharacterized protein LOC113225728 [Hyposmocoma kahamanoa]